MIFTLLSWLIGFSTYAKSINIVIIDVVPAGFQHQGRTQGTTYELINQIADRANFKYDTKLKPFARVVQELANGDADMSMLLPNSALDGQVVLVAPVYELKSMIVSMPNEPIKELTELSGKKVGMLRNATFYRKIPNHEQLDLYEVKNYRQGIKMLKHGRINALLAIDQSFYFLLKNEGLERSEFAPPLYFDTQHMYLQVSNKLSDESTINQLKSIVNDLKSSGEANAILKKYVGE
nr:transporter substrate-binding domain-containing protein [Vibrio sinus]